MIRLFSFLKSAAVSYTYLSNGSDGALLITTGNTVVLAAGVLKQYSSIQIDSGGTLLIEGSSFVMTEIYCKNAFILDGQIICRYTGSTSGSISGNTTLGSFPYSAAVTQRSGGAGGNGVSQGASGGAGGAGGADGSGGGGGGGAANGGTPAYGGAGGTEGSAGSNGYYYNAGTVSSTPGGAGNSTLSDGGGTYGYPGAAGGGSGGGGGGYDREVIFKGPTYEIIGGGGGGGGYRGKHGNFLFLCLEGTISGAGFVYANGLNGFNGASGSPGLATGGYTPGGAGGTGGGAAGGDGGSILTYKRVAASVTYSNVVSGGAGGTGDTSGTSGVAGASTINNLAG